MLNLLYRHEDFKLREGKGSSGLGWLGICLERMAGAGAAFQNLDGRSREDTPREALVGTVSRPETVVNVWMSPHPIISQVFSVSVSLF